MENFQSLATDILRSGLKVVIIGDREDATVLEGCFSSLDDVMIETGLSLPGLLTLIAGARLFIGNSSGPLHLAGLAQTPHVGLFPQNRVSSPDRWCTLPWPGAPEDAGAYLISPGFPKNCVRCELEKCSYFNCVAAVPIERIGGAVRAWGLESLFPASSSIFQAAST